LRRGAFGPPLERNEARVPELVEHRAHGRESFEVHAVEAAFRVDSDVHEPNFAKQLEVLARSRRRKAGGLCELGGSAFVVTSEAQHRATAGMTHRAYCVVE
jgi:hypothetical protein